MELSTVIGQFSSREFRNALGCFATGVTVVSSADSLGRPVGVTANSFTSLSLDPPLVVVCLSNGSETGAVLREADQFAINVLRSDQQKISNRFASKFEDRFSDLQWQEGELGVPVFPESMCIFECSRYAVHEGGDHFILVGRVLSARYQQQQDPLLFFQGRYRRIDMLQA